MCAPVTNTTPFFDVCSTFLYLFYIEISLQFFPLLHNILHLSDSEGCEICSIFVPFSIHYMDVR